MASRFGRVAAAAVPAALLASAALVGDYRLPRQANARALNRGRTWEHKSRTDSKGVRQVWVPPGCFEMGSNPLADLSASANETPRHTVCIGAGFWIDEFEATNQSFLEFARQGGYEVRRYWSQEGWQAQDGRRALYRPVRGYDGPRQPRVKITWYEAEAYAAWRGGKLPTEAQWE
jgi:formylglycine-generating enzyme required for sulfatase activity